jgi:uncharacterized protein YfkK (UPF0435 family)
LKTLKKCTFAWGKSNTVNQKILDKEAQQFIRSHEKSDLSKVILKGSPFKDIEMTILAQQIDSLSRCKNKLPDWYSTPGIFFPPKISVEQSSSFATASFKASLISGKKLIDITGGMGVDDYFFADNFDLIQHCELNEELLQITKHNFKTLGKNNVRFHSGDGLEFLKQNNENYDWIYTDPARRDDKKNKVFKLSDCTPDIPVNLELLFNYTNNIMLKASPVLDITQGINELKHVKDIHIVSHKNECKELLFILKKGYTGSIQIHTINLIDEHTTQELSFSRNQETEINYSLPLNFLYEPNASIMKSGSFSELVKRFPVSKLHTNSHLFTSNKIVENFPGRSFVIHKELNYNKKELQKHIPEKKANISVRNFRSDVATIRKKTKIQEGGNLYLFFTTNMHNKPIVLLCSKA